jgi:UDP-N-acetylglucosamine diphosphorylase / glucose-1-phosphate thymidylyltransferase / UDP-N-acetylgalactosamine diphosphorylase / glucosamine-1-phosphate N-acetyltransferase / galactosamine-1-phosphate N-acetyltransferase
MALILFDTEQRTQLYPFTYTRAIAYLRVGMLTQIERWQLITKQPVYVHTKPYLQALYSQIPVEEHIWIDARIIATDILWQQIEQMQTNSAIEDENGMVACKVNVHPNVFGIENLSYYITQTHQAPKVERLQYAHDMFLLNDAICRTDFKLLTHKKSSQPISITNTVPQQANIFIEQGAKVEYAFLNSTTGPIYIAKNATISEGSYIRGPFYLGENSLVKMGAKIYGATTTGPNCVLGGEIKNVVFLGYSNKAHDGYLGDSVIGEWCNIGAGTSNSNVKNTGGLVQIWNEGLYRNVEVGQKCGVLMGDYTRVAINSSINTGSYMGICSNVFGNGLLPKQINNFRWGTTENYILEKAFTDINNWMQMKNQQLSTEQQNVLSFVFNND